MSWIRRRRSGRPAVCAPIVTRQPAFAWAPRTRPAVVLPFRVPAKGWSAA